MAFALASTVAGQNLSFRSCWRVFVVVLAKVALLIEALRSLQQDPDPALISGNNDDILKWGIAHWNPARLTDRQEIQEFKAPL